MSNGLTDKEGLPGRLSYAIHALESTAINISMRFIPDATVRANYARAIKSSAKEIIDGYDHGEYTVEEAAEIATNMRNKIMNIARTRTTMLGNAFAKDMKARGITLFDLQEKYAEGFYSQKFSSLTKNQQGKVNYEIILKSGNSNLFVTSLYRKLKPAGKALILISFSVAVYDIFNARDKVRATAYNGLILGGGVLSGSASGAAAGVACGPGAPICVSLGLFIGGILGASGMQYVLNKTFLSHY